MMKRFVMLLAICMLLTACTGEPIPTQTNPTTPVAPTTQPNLGITDAEDLKPMPGHDAQNKYLLTSIVGFQETDNFFCGTNRSGHYLQYFDKSSGISGALCADPACTHDTNDCGAYIERGTSLSYYDGRLYWLAKDTEDGNAFVLWQSDISGVNRRKVTELDFLDVILTYQPQQYVIHRGRLYMMGMANAVVGATVGHRITLLSTPLDGSGEVTVLYDQAFANGAWPTMRFVGNYVYFSVPFREEGQVFTWTITRYNERTGQSEVIYQESGLPQAPGDIWVTEQGEVYIPAADADRAYVYMLEDGQRVEAFSWEEKDYNVPKLLDGIALITGRMDGICYVKINALDGTAIYDGMLFPRGIPEIDGDPNMDYSRAFIGGDAKKVILVMEGMKGEDSYTLVLEINDNLKPTILWSTQK